MGIKYKGIVVFFLQWACITLSQDWLPVVNRGGREYFTLELKEGMSFLTLVNSSSIPLDTLLKDNPDIRHQTAPGTIIYIRAERSDVKYSVVSGDTPFRIAKQFDVSLEALYASNPKLENEALKVGQIVFIHKGLIRQKKEAFDPPKITEAKINSTPDDIVLRGFEFGDSILFYKVRSGETLSEIAKRFFTKSNKLRELNKLKGDKLKVGTTLKIPIIEDDILPLQHSIKSIELATNSKIENGPLEDANNFPPTKVDFFKIGVFLSFGMDTINYPLKGLPKMAMEFYMGAKMAIDSLDRMGCKGEVRFFDYCSSKEQIANLISSGTLDDYHVLIGPVQMEAGQLLEPFCEERNIAYVYQGMSLPKIKSRKSNVFYVHTEMIPQLEKLSRLAQDAASSNQVIFYQTNLPSDTARERNFLAKYNQLAENGNNRIICADFTTLKGLLNSGKQNVVICVSLDKQKVLELTSTTIKNKTAVKLVGLKEWTDWKELNGTLKNESDFFYYSTSCLDYSNPSVKQFHKEFRSIYNVDLSKFSLFGFDVILGFAGRITECATSMPYHGLFIKFDYPENSNIPTRYNYGLSLCRFKNFKQIKDAKFN